MTSKIISKMLLRMVSEDDVKNDIRDVIKNDKDDKKSDTIN